MWTKPTADVKCPRGDCCYYDVPDDSPQCGNCTCNYRSGGMCGTFNYTSKSIKEAESIEERKRAEAGMAVEKQAAAPASDRASGGTR